MLKWFQKKKDERSSSHYIPKTERGLGLKKQLNLPRNFAKNVINLELQCDRPDVSRAHVNKLMDLYTSAIEYYNCLSDSENQYYFQSKLHTLLNRYEIKKLLGPPKEDLPTGSSSWEEQYEASSYHRRGMSLQQMRERHIEKKRQQDHMKLNIYNSGQKHEEKKEKIIESQLQREEDAIKVVQKDILSQSENFKKRLAERQKSRDTRSLSTIKGFNSSLSLNLNPLKNKEDYSSQFMTNPLSQRRTPALQNLNSSNQMFPFLGTSNLGNESFQSGARSFTTAGGGLAQKISSALNRIVWGINNNNVINDDDEVTELVNLIDQLNQITELTVKLNNQSKLCKILEANEDFYSGKVGTQAGTTDKDKQEKGLDLSIKQIMDQSREELKRLHQEREKAIEDYLESHTEEKFLETQDVKKKYQTSLNFLKNSKGANKEEKIKIQEDKREAELKELQIEFDNKKREGLQKIKAQYNELSAKVNVDAESIEGALRKNLQKAYQLKLQVEHSKIGEGASPIKRANTERNIEEQKRPQTTILDCQAEESSCGLDVVNQYKPKHKESTGYIGERDPPQLDQN